MAKFLRLYDLVTRPVIPFAAGAVVGSVFSLYVLGEALARGFQSVHP